MKKVILGVFSIGIVVSVFLQILAIMNLFSYFISIPFLFTSILLFILTLNQRNRFKGF